MVTEYIPLWQTINYVGLTGVTLIVSGACLLYHLHYRVEFAAVISAIYFCISSVLYFLIAIATGLHPIVNTASIRPYIQLGRSFQLITLIWLLIVLSRRVTKVRRQ